MVWVIQDARGSAIWFTTTFIGRLSHTPRLLAVLLPPRSRLLIRLPYLAGAILLLILQLQHSKSWCPAQQDSYSNRYRITGSK